MTIAELKANISIEEVVGRYANLVGTGNRLSVKENPLREEKTPSFFVYRDTQKFFDYGSGDRGDVVDFIEKVENLNRKDALSFLQVNYLNGVEITSKPRPLPKMRSRQIKKDNDYLFAQLEIKANKYLSASPKRGMKWGYFELNIEEADGETRIENVIQVHPVYEKLFEDYIVPTDLKFARYLFDKVIGYDDYFDCPVIVIRDESETPVNIIKYRPHRDGKPLMQSGKPLKYLNLKSEETPDVGYIFPLQAQMQKIMAKEGYTYVGEGLKNAINASLMGIPFVSIEGAASIKSGLINFLKSDRMKDIVMIGAFDGDHAGEVAYKKITSQIPMKNEWSFDSGMDFTNFIKGWR